MKIHYTKMRVVFTTLLIAITLGLFAQTSCPITCLSLKTYTQGGWGAAPSGSNPGTFLDQNFAANFPAPGYLTIGSTNKLQLTSAAAVRAFLPNGTTPAVLPSGTSINKTKTNFNNVLAGQLVALCLNITFDKKIPGFAPATPNLKDQIIASGPFVGKTVQFLYDNANLIIGGGSGYFPKTLSEYTTAIDNVNRNNDNGGINLLNFFVCELRACNTSRNSLCNAVPTGSISVTNSGGLAPFTYTWTVPTGYTPIGNVSSATGLKPGTYSVKVTDASGQSATTSYTITEPGAINLTTNGTNPLCSTNSGTISIDANGGTGAFSFKVNGVSVSSPCPANTSGNYTVVATDANGCTKSSSVSITIPPVLNLTTEATNPLCASGSGSITFGATGGTGAISFKVNGVSATSPYTAVASGDYTIEATDANGCTKSSTVTIAIPSEISLTANGSNPLCSTGSGSITFGATGGTGVFSYTVNDVAATSPYSASASGDYSIVATDANGCTKSSTITIAFPTAISLTANGSNPLCASGSGSITFGATGGTGVLSYTVNDVAATSPYSASAGGDYSIVATDANGCTKSSSITISIPTKLNVSVELNPNCETRCSGTAAAIATGGTSPYTYAWVVNNEEASQTTATLSGLCPLSESFQAAVVVTDANGCTAEADSTTTPGCIYDCNPLKTFTQGGWGATPNGNNPGVYLHANFDAAFPSGITLGCTNTISWTSAQAITDWLPSGTTPTSLPSGDITNPIEYNNVLAAQLLAATLNVGFDAYDADFSSNEGALGGRYFADGAFAGMTVNDVIQWANDAIGGCDMHGYSFADYNTALTNVNENYDNGNQDLGHLVCTSNATKLFTATEVINTNVYPNPARTEANVTFEGKIGQIATIAVYDLSGRLLMTQRMPTRNGVNQFHLNVSKFTNQTYAIRVIAGARKTTSLIVVQH